MDGVRRFAELSPSISGVEPIVMSVHGREALSELYAYDVEFLSGADRRLVSGILGKPATLTLHGARESGPPLVIAGVIARVSSAVGGGMARRYRCRVVPRLWMLDRNVHSRIFQEKTVADIATAVLKDRRIDHLAVLSDPLPARAYCVQYGESDFRFLSRLFEHDGIFYFIRHGGTGNDPAALDTLVYGDGRHAFHTGHPTTLVLDLSGREAGRVHGVEHVFGVYPQRWDARDVDTADPFHPVEAGERSMPPPGAADGAVRPFTPNDAGVFAFHGAYDTPDGMLPQDMFRKLARRRMEAIESEHGHTLEGRSAIPGLSPGMVVTFSTPGGGMPPELLGSYVVTAVEHELTDGAGMGDGGAGSTYANRFVCAPLSEAADPLAVVFRPPRRTPKPVIPGPHTAIVVGTPADAVHTDQQRRVWVKFPWDRNTAQDDTTPGVWLRVSQAWAGDGWGDVRIPAVGHEVLVSFLDGDPDRPVVTGRLYNGVNEPPSGKPVTRRDARLDLLEKLGIDVQGLAGSLPDVNVGGFGIGVGAGGIDVDAPDTGGVGGVGIGDILGKLDDLIDVLDRIAAGALVTGPDGEKSRKPVDTSLWSDRSGNEIALDAHEKQPRLRFSSPAYKTILEVGKGLGMQGVPYDIIAAPFLMFNEGGINALTDGQHTVTARWSYDKAGRGRFVRTTGISDTTSMGLTRLQTSGMTTAYHGGVNKITFGPMKAMGLPVPGLPGCTVVTYTHPAQHAYMMPSQFYYVLPTITTALDRTQLVVSEKKAVTSQLVSAVSSIEGYESRVVQAMTQTTAAGVLRYAAQVFDVGAVNQVAIKSPSVNITGLTVSVSGAKVNLGGPPA